MPPIENAFFIRSIPSLQKKSIEGSILFNFKVLDQIIYLDLILIALFLFVKKLDRPIYGFF